MTTIKVTDVYLNRNTFKENKLIREVDCSYTKWKNNSMGSAFHGCSNLINVSNMNENVSNMDSTFALAYNLRSISAIPNSVTNMMDTFAACYNFQGIADIPNSVVNMWRTFDRCYSMVNPPTIPNSVTSLDLAFVSCNNLSRIPTIPNSVTSLSDTFHSCSNIQGTISIPDSIVSMPQTFYGCNKITTVSKLPNNVKDLRWTFMNCSNLVSIPSLNKSYNIEKMQGTFDGCVNLSGDIYINSAHITSALECFNNTSLQKNVYIPYYNSEDVNKPFYCWDCYDYETQSTLQFYVSTDYTNTTIDSDWDATVFYENGAIDNRYVADYMNWGGEVEFEVRTTNYSEYYSGTRNSDGDSSVFIPAGSPTDTYSSFISAGYDEFGSTNGVYLKEFQTEENVVSGLDNYRTVNLIEGDIFEATIIKDVDENGTMYRYGRGFNQSGQSEYISLSKSDDDGENWYSVEIPEYSDVYPECFGVWNGVIYSVIDDWENESKSYLWSEDGGKTWDTNKVLTINGQTPENELKCISGTDIPLFYSIINDNNVWIPKLYKLQNTSDTELTFVGNVTTWMWGYAWSNNTLAITSETNHIVTSKYPFNNTVITTVFTGNTINPVICGDDKLGFLAIPSADLNYYGNADGVRTSMDGVNWTQYNVPSEFNNYYLRFGSSKCDKGMWVVGLEGKWGEETQDMHQPVYTCDKTNWTYQENQEGFEGGPGQFFGLETGMAMTHEGMDLFKANYIYDNK